MEQERLKPSLPSQAAKEAQTSLSWDEAPFVPSIPHDDKEAYEISRKILDLLEDRPENASPTNVFSMVLTLNECAMETHGGKDPRELAHSLYENYQTGLQAMMRSTKYNGQEHDGLRHDLYLGYINQLNILQSRFAELPEERSNKPTA